MSQAVHLVTKNLPGTPFHLHSHSPVRSLALFGCCENKRNLGFGLTGCLKRLFFSYRFVLCVPFASQQSTGVLLALLQLNFESFCKLRLLPTMCLIE